MHDSDLGQIFTVHQGRLVDKWSHYFAAYDTHFGPFREGVRRPDGSVRPTRLLEIGVSHGGSLQMWRTFFGPAATIVGIDVDPRCAAAADGVTVRIGSQADPDFLLDVVSEMGGVDIVLDDGSHYAKHHKVSFDTLFPVLSDGGVYAVEDLHTAYWPKFGGGLRRRGTFIEVAKDVIDDMNGWAHGRTRRVLPAGTAVSQLAIYDSMVFLHKSVERAPARLKTGSMSF